MKSIKLKISFYLILKLFSHSINKNDIFSKNNLNLNNIKFIFFLQSFVDLKNYSNLLINI